VQEEALARVGPGAVAARKVVEELAQMKPRRPAAGCVRAVNGGSDGGGVQGIVESRVADQSGSFPKSLAGTG
jgi:hypothetical protein